MTTMTFKDLIWTSVGIYAWAAAPERCNVPNRMDKPLDDGQLS